jgi:hypothetical protein
MGNVFYLLKYKTLPWFKRHDSYEIISLPTLPFFVRIDVDEYLEKDKWR